MFGLRLVKTSFRSFQTSSSQLQKLYVGNLSWTTTEDNLRDLFSSYGSVTDAFIVRDKLSGKSRGFGFVQFDTLEQASAAKADLDGAEHNGRTLRVNEATNKHPVGNFDFFMTELAHSKLYDIAWGLFETNQDYQTMPASVCSMLAELNLKQLTELVQEIHKTIDKEDKQSINFALILSFKRTIISCAAKTWKLEELDCIVPSLHPMECVYMLVNSMSYSNEEYSWFRKDACRAYGIFEYIVRWMNWKVDDKNGDEYYYETYFHDYDKNERKKIMATIGIDMLGFIQNNPQSQLVGLVSESLKEIVPLLDHDILVLFWKFYKNLLKTNADDEGIHRFYEAISSGQIRNLFSGEVELTTPLSTATSPISPTEQKVLGLIYSRDAIGYIASRYNQSAEKGDAFLGANVPLLSSNLYPQCISAEYPLDETSLCAITRLSLESESLQTITNLLRSKGITDESKAVQTLFYQWSHMQPLHPKVSNYAPVLLKDEGISHIITSWFQEPTPPDTKLTEFLQQMGQEAFNYGW